LGEGRERRGKVGKSGKKVRGGWGKVAKGRKE
jgi:hypothetical protein